MSFSLPELPYAHDTLAPYMSRKTLEYHHDKRHLAYVNNCNLTPASARTSPRLMMADISGRAEALAGAPIITFGGR